MVKKDSLQVRYDQLWRRISIQDPRLKYTWPHVKNFQDKSCLEIGCGNNPVIPLENSVFLESSQTAVDNLKAAGLKAYLGTVEDLSFDDNSFDLVVAWHVLEHVKHDKRALSEISRVLKKGGYFLFASPLWPQKFTEIDCLVGHLRRYQPQDLVKDFKNNHLIIKKYKATKGLLACFFKNPLFFPLVLKIYQHPRHADYFGLPKPVVNFLFRLTSLIEKMSTSPWQKGKLVNLQEADHLALFCQKT